MTAADPVRFASGAPPPGDDARLAAEVADFFRPAEARLDDRLRAAITRSLAELVGSVEAVVRRYAARLLTARGDDAAAATLLATRASALARLTATGVLADPALMAEVIAQARLAAIAEALPIAAERPGLLLHLAEQADPDVAAAARALLAADGHAAADVPPELHHRLVWWCAAANRDTVDPAIDRVLAEAAQRAIDSHEGAERAEALAARLVAAIDPMPAELAALLADALGDRRPGLFVAILARALTIETDAARALVLDPVGDGLWYALRSLELARAEIARIALALAQADPRRDIDAFAVRLDAIAATDPGAARGMIGPLLLPSPFRSAIAALARR